MQTTHRVHHASATKMRELADNSIALVVTSPPYPMIEMWDEVFASQDAAVRAALESGDGPEAFAAMHGVLDQVWRECARVVRPGGFVCINIGDATRTVDGTFRLYTNHARITTALETLGMQSLPMIHWWKPTNAPNKFMGSGMLPAGAYVTLEHEYILIFRKGGKRTFTAKERETRRQSAFFWEERNVWFSDVWDFKGARQLLGNAEARNRSAAFPLELAYRLILMYSLTGETVLDPFAGTGTTAAAALIAARSSVGYESEAPLLQVIGDTVSSAAGTANQVVARRVEAHKQFLDARAASDAKPPGHRNTALDIPVITSQEIDMLLYTLDALSGDIGSGFTGEHSALAAGDLEEFLSRAAVQSSARSPSSSQRESLDSTSQLSLW